jgi:hypothetical protein
MMVSCAQQLLSTVLAGATSALKDEVNRFEFAKFIEAQRRSLTALFTPATASPSRMSKLPVK